jgi:hypothetical protein
MTEQNDAETECAKCGGELPHGGFTLKENERHGPGEMCYGCAGMTPRSEIEIECPP